MNTPNEDSVKLGQIWFDMTNNGDFSNEGEILRFEDLRVASDEEIEQFKIIREDWKVADGDDS